MAALSGSEEQRKVPADSSRSRAFKHYASADESIPVTAAGGRITLVRLS